MDAEKWKLPGQAVLDAALGLQGMELFRDLYGVDQPQGCTDGEIAAVKEIFGAIPAVVEDFWRTFGRTPRLNYVQDTWILPEHYFKSLPDPPVYIQMEDDAPGCCPPPPPAIFWKRLCSTRVSGRWSTPRRRFIG